MVLDAQTATEAYGRITQAQTAAGGSVPESFAAAVQMLNSLPAAGVL